MNLTYDMITKLKSVGFTFEQFEHLCSPGMTYYYEDNEYTIGGAWDSTPCSENDQKVAREGTWLPGEGDLARWLELTNHNIEIKYEDTYYHGKATDKMGNVFEGGGADLLCCLYKMIYKICKQSKGTVKPENILMLETEKCDNEIVVCDECGSEYLASSSKMVSLCPECAHVLYGYENCDHEFKDGKCTLCLWDGSRSDYINKLLKNSDG